MKVKVKETGEVIEVYLDMNAIPVMETGATRLYRDNSGKRYLNTELDFVNVNNVDWEMIRINASIAAMQGIVSAVSPERFTIRISETAVAEASVEYADALIHELKKKGGENEIK